MTDEEVGAHFKLIQLGQEFFHLNIHVMPFIEKLVNERARGIWAEENGTYTGLFSGNNFRTALSQFSITVEEWEDRTQFKL